MKKQEVFTVSEAKLKLMRFCAYRERCHQEVEEKLRQYQLTPLEKQTVISLLIADNFLNEERFASVFVRDKFNLQHWGKSRLQRELKLRRISDYLIQKALLQIDPEDYLNTFNRLAEKKWQQLGKQPLLQKKKKINDYLLRKGYEYDLINAFLHTLS